MVGQVVHVRVGLVADEQPPLGIEHAQTQRHVVDRRIELQVQSLRLALFLQQLDRLRLEHGHRAGELADFVLVGGAGHIDRGVVAGKPQQRRADALQTRQDAAEQEEADRADHQSARGGRGRHPGDEGAGVGGDLGQGLGCVTGLALALGDDAAPQVLGGLGVALRGGGGIGGTLIGDEGEHQGAVPLEVGELHGQRVLLAKAHRCHVARSIVAELDEGGAFPQRRVAGAHLRRRHHQAAQLIERVFELAGGLHRLQTDLASPDRRFPGLAGEADGGAGQDVDHGQHDRDRAVKLGRNLRAGKPQSFQHRTHPSVPSAQHVRTSARGRPDKTPRLTSPRRSWLRLAERVGRRYSPTRHAESCASASSSAACYGRRLKKSRAGRVGLLCKSCAMGRAGAARCAVADVHHRAGADRREVTRVTVRHLSDCRLCCCRGKATTCSHFRHLSQEGKPRCELANRGHKREFLRCWQVVFHEYSRLSPAISLGS